MRLGSMVLRQKLLVGFATHFVKAKSKFQPEIVKPVQKLLFENFYVQIFLRILLIPHGGAYYIYFTHIDTLTKQNTLH